MRGNPWGDVVQYGCLEYHPHKYPLSLKAADRYRGSHELNDGPINIWATELARQR
jgi:hypothetical protein